MPCHQFAVYDFGTGSSFKNIFTTSEGWGFRESHKQTAIGGPIHSNSASKAWRKQSKSCREDLPFALKRMQTGPIMSWQITSSCIKFSQDGRANTHSLVYTDWSIWNCHIFYSCLLLHKQKSTNVFSQPQSLYKSISGQILFWSDPGACQNTTGCLSTHVTLVQHQRVSSCNITWLIGGVFSNRGESLCCAAPNLLEQNNFLRQRVIDIYCLIQSDIELPILVGPHSAPKCAPKTRQVLPLLRGSSGNRHSDSPWLLKKILGTLTP